MPWIIRNRNSANQHLIGHLKHHKVSTTSTTATKDIVNVCQPEWQPMKAKIGSEPRMSPKRYMIYRLGLGCLTPLSTIFQLYRGQF
jgi:hypothetical protein